MFSDLILTRKRVFSFPVFNLLMFKKMVTILKLFGAFGATNFSMFTIISDGLNHPRPVRVTQIKCGCAKTLIYRFINKTLASEL